MDDVQETLSLLQRRRLIQDASRRADLATRLTADRDLLRIRERLAQLPTAMQAVLHAAARLDRPLERLTVREVERCRRAVLCSAARSQPEATL